ncbi:MAG: rod shape-determining protein MreC [Acidobacteriota bacterium]
MSANPAQQRSHWLLAALLLAQIVLMSASARDPQSGQSVLRTWIMTPLSFVANRADRVYSAVSGWIASYTALRGVREENARLREQVERLTAERNEAQERATRLDLIERDLGLNSRSSYPSIAANVVSRDLSLWSRRLTIDRGTLDGVRKDMPVVTNSGIVGRVVGVGPNWAQVQVITDKLAGAGAMLQRSRAMGEMRGLGTDRCELKSISTAQEVQTGEAIITTGLDRIYPKGLLIGTVEQVESDPNAPSLRIIIAPSARVDRVEHVLVLMVEEKDLKIGE